MEKIITRLMGLLLAAVAVQFIFNALKAENGLLGP
ncbi:MAG: MarC family protein [Nitrospiraceae bacterium]